MTENNIPSTNLLLSFFGIKGNITTEFLLVCQCSCQHIGQSTVARALGAAYFAKEHLDESSHILTSAI